MKTSEEAKTVSPIDLALQSGICLFCLSVYNQTSKCKFEVWVLYLNLESHRKNW